MSVSQQGPNATASSSRRRRRGGGGGGGARRVPGGAPPTTASPGRNQGAITNGSTMNGGGGRGHGRRTLWEDKDISVGPGRVDQSSSLNVNSGITTTVRMGSSAGGSAVRQTMGGVRESAGSLDSGGAGNGRGVNPAMLESEFLAATGRLDAGMDDPAVSLSLEEVPYDRSLRWCNTASDSRPRPTMNVSSGVFGRMGAAITQDTSDYERLDRHYQELWKDREGLPGPGPVRGRGPKPGRGGRGGGRGAGRGFAVASGGRLSTSVRVPAGRGDPGAINRGEGGPHIGGRGGGGGGQSRGPSFGVAGRQTGGSPSQASRGGGDGGFAVGSAGLEAGGGAGVGGGPGGAGQGGRVGKRISTRGGRGVVGVAGRGIGGRVASGYVGGGMQAPRSSQASNGGGLQHHQHHMPASGGYQGYNRGPLSQQQQHMRTGSSQVRTGPVGRSSSFSPQGGPGIARSNSGPQQRLQQQHQHQQQQQRESRGSQSTLSSNRRFAIAGAEQQRDTWGPPVVVRGSSLSPLQSAVISPTYVGGDSRALMKSPLGAAGSASNASTPPLLPAPPSTIPMFSPDSPEYLSELASIAFHSSTPSPPQAPPRGAIRGHSPTTVQSSRYDTTSPPQHHGSFGRTGPTLLTTLSDDSYNNTYNTASCVAMISDGGARRNGMSTTPQPVLEGRGRRGLFSAQFSRSTDMVCRSADFVSSMKSADTFSESKGFPSATSDVTVMDGKSSLLLGTPTSAYSTPRRSPRPSVDMNLLTDPGLDVDIQDICADHDLNANAPAFVPGGY